MPAPGGLGQGSAVAMSNVDVNLARLQMSNKTKCNRELVQGVNILWMVLYVVLLVGQHIDGGAALS